MKYNILLNKSVLIADYGRSKLVAARTSVSKTGLYWFSQLVEMSLENMIHEKQLLKFFFKTIE